MTVSPCEDHRVPENAPGAGGLMERRQPVTRAPGPGPALRRGAASALCAGVVGALLTGCGASSARVNGVLDAGRAFQRAVAGGAFAAACDLLAPGTREQLEEDARVPCDKALAGRQLPTARPGDSAEVYGRQAAISAGGQKLFLSQFKGGWKVVAAGCTPSGGDKPYRCAVKGG